MQLNKVIAACFSPTDTSKKTVEAIAKGVCPEITVWDLTLPAAREACYTCAPDDLLVVGAPVYGGRIPLDAVAGIRRIHGNCTPVVIAAVYGNRDFDDALLELRDLLSAQGFIPVAGGAFIGEHSFGNTVAPGRPDADDLAKCADFGADIAAMLKDATTGDFALKVPGNYPYKERGPKGPGFAHEVTDACIKCLRCAKVCPTAAISPTDPAVKNVDLCIKCQACAKKCPKAARIVPDGFIEMISAKLGEMCGPDRKEPQLFLGK